MNVIEYKSNDVDMNNFKNDLKYWSNCCGDLHHHAQYDIEESELPEDLRRAYSELWTENSGSLCYLVEYKEKHGIALINEFDDCFADDEGVSMDELYLRMKQKAESLKKNELFKDAKIVCTEYAGFKECHELIVILPTETEIDTFEKIANCLYETVYK